MEISFTLWTMQDILSKIPFNTPAGEAVHLDFSEIAAPYYVKHGFRVSIFYVDDTFPMDAVCSIFSPQNVVTIVIIIKGKFEDALNTWQQKSDVSVLDLCYRRRELYCHEVSHLIAIIRAFPGYRHSRARKEFEDKIRKKFEASTHEDQSYMAHPLGSAVSQEMPEVSPSVFHRDHFRYENDGLNYFALYAELMLNYDILYNALKKICATKKEDDYIYMDEIYLETLVPPQFFTLFPEKKAEIIKILEDGFN